MTSGARGGRTVRLVGSILLLGGACVACSQSPSAPAPSPLDPATTSALQALVDAGAVAAASVRLDPAVVRLAAQISTLEHHRDQMTLAASLLETDAREEADASIKARLEKAVQEDRNAAVSDNAEIAALQKKAASMTYASLATDGGADNVIRAKKAIEIASHAQAVLNGVGQPDSGVTATGAAIFLQQVAVVEEDDAPGGHNAYSRIMVQMILSDAGLPDGAVP